MSDETPPTDADIHLACAAAEGCAESRLLMTRRAMLGMSFGLYSWAFMPRYAEAATEATSDPRLLVVVLRGGMDGLSTVVPVGDRHYVSMRGDIAIPKSATIKLNSLFGLHPALKNFGRMYQAGDASVVHATCVPLRNRSHFDTQDNLENGLPDRASNTTGWLNRMLTALPKGRPIVANGAIQIGEAPLILRGPAPVLGWSPAPYAHLKDPTLYMVRTLYRERDPELLDVLDMGIKADQLAEGVDQDDGDISSLRKAFRGAARLVAAPKGPRIAVLSVGGWDTHADQGGATGVFANVLGELDDGIADFRKECGNVWGQTVMLLVTEFGRTVRVNGDRGTDHGVGTVALLAGGAVNGKRVHGDWPGLAPAKLFEGNDLRATTDLRSVFKGILQDHIGVPSRLLDTVIFPESARVAPMRGLVRAARRTSEAEAPAARVPSREEPAIARYRRGESARAPAAPALDL